ncbi:Hypothetical predicted protein [Mytilus galloprovincialis]|uniref:Tyr recombinase domain-containing protein n=1 Tax=Mytilus galloprovincialis TaxID=29158 RepID=A0A8B6GYV0_MYTGA|nr:Hypothetical predicted protein [Mytilus galloprovincialis]
MIGRCVKKIIKDKADVLFVGPLWPTQPWFVQVMKLLINNPYVIKANKKLLTLPYKDIVHPLEKTLNLMVCRISGTDYKTEEFQRKLPLLSWHHGDQELKNNIKTYIKKWFIFCLERKEDKFHTSVELVLEFLTYLFECGLSYSALNSARSALSAFGLTFDNVPVGKHPLVIRFLKGVYHLRPTVHNDVNIWDVSIVLRLLRRLSPVADISVKDLTLKLVMLIALTNATRSQSIHLLKLSNMQKQKDCFRFKIFDLLKQSRPGYKNPEVILKSFPPDRRLCVYLELKEYLKRTVDIRSEEDSLILSYIKPHKKVSCSTISRWIKSIMCRAGIDTSIFKAHSTRSASTSKAKRNIVPYSDILAKAGWSSSTTFGKFYDKTVTTSDVFAEKVLQI